MKKILLVTFLLAIQYPVFAQIAGSIYFNYVNGKEAGIYLFKKDSTFIYAGFIKESKRSVVKGKWNLKDNCLQLDYESYYDAGIPELLQFSEVNYISKTIPSFDSVYYEIEVTDSLAKSEGCQIEFPGKYTVNTDMQGKLKLSFPLTKENMAGKIIFKEGVKFLHINEGSYEGFKVHLNPNQNYHNIKIRRARKYSVSFSTLIYPWKDVLCFSSQYELIKINQSNIEFKKVNEIISVHNYFNKLKNYYSPLNKYFTIIETEFVNEID